MFPARWSLTSPPTGCWPRQRIRQCWQTRTFRAADIQSVACCSMREGIGFYDRNGEVYRVCANVDVAPAAKSRSLKRSMIIILNRKFMMFRPDAGTLSAMPRLLWLAHHRSGYLPSGCHSSP